MILCKSTAPARSEIWKRQRTFRTPSSAARGPSAFDSFTVVLDSDGKQQLIYKHAISTIAPARPLNLGEAGQADT